jgi:hypothetical protein
MKCECGFESDKIKVFPFHCGCGRRYTASCSEPTLIAKVASVTSDVAKWAVAGVPRRTSDEQAACKAICQTCEFFNAQKNNCKKCGCYVNWAAWLKTKSCPIGKWPDTSTTKEA